MRSSLSLCSVVSSICWHCRRAPADLWTGSQAKRLEIKVYLSFNQQNSDKMELLQLILSSASTLNMIFSALFWSASVLHVKSIMLNSFQHSQS